MVGGTTGPALAYSVADSEESADWLGGFKMQDIKVQSDEGTTGADGQPCPIIDLSGAWTTNLDRLVVMGTNGATSACAIRLNGWYSNVIENSILGRFCINGVEIQSRVDSADGFSGGYTRPTHQVSIHNNQLGYMNPDSAIENGIKIDGGTYGVSNISIQNNVVYSGDNGVSVEGATDNIVIMNNAWGLRAANGSWTAQMTNGITADGQTTNLVTIGNTGAQNRLTGHAATSNSGFQSRVSIENGSVQGVNIPKVVAVFDGAGNLRGGIGSGATGTNYNVSGVARNGLGTYTISFTDNLQTDNYSINGFVGGGTAAMVYLGDLNTDMSNSQCKVYVRHVTNHLIDPDYISVTIT